MDFALILGVLKEGLKLRNSKESTKFIDKIIKLERNYYDELKKPYHERSQLLLDSVMLDLETIARNFVQYAGKDQ